MHPVAVQSPVQTGLRFGERRRSLLGIVPERVVRHHLDGSGVGGRLVEIAEFIERPLSELDRQRTHRKYGAGQFADGGVERGCRDDPVDQSEVVGPLGRDRRARSRASPWPLYRGWHGRSGTMGVVQKRPILTLGWRTEPLRPRPQGRRPRCQASSRRRSPSLAPGRSRVEEPANQEHHPGAGGEQVMILGLGPVRHLAEVVPRTENRPACPRITTLALGSVSIAVSAASSRPSSERDSAFRVSGRFKVSETTPSSMRTSSSFCCLFRRGVHLASFRVCREQLEARSASQRLVANAVRLIGVGPQSLVPLSLVRLIIAVAPDDLAIPLEGEDVGRDPVEEPTIVADHDRASRRSRGSPLPGREHVDVEVVGRLVEQEQVPAALEELGQVDPVALTPERFAIFFSWSGPLKLN